MYRTERVNEMKTIAVRTSNHTQMLDITDEVRTAVRESRVDNGACLVFCPHTTAGITINENADPDVAHDLLMGLAHVAPRDMPFHHAEGNSDGHLKSSLVGCSEYVIVEKGSLVLGKWQGIYFCEFDGPRRRSVHIQVIASSPA